MQEICLTTVGSPAVDTVLTVSVTYGTAGPEGKDASTLSTSSVLGCGMLAFNQPFSFHGLVQNKVNLVSIL